MYIKNSSGRGGYTKELLSKAVQSCKTDLSMKEFCNYFISTYLNRKQEWVACFRKGSTVNTNMFVEAFHCVLKHVYLKGVVNKRMNHCIITLMKLARDKIYKSAWSKSKKARALGAFKLSTRDIQPV